MHAVAVQGDGFLGVEDDLAVGVLEDGAGGWHHGELEVAGGVEDDEGLVGSAVGGREGQFFVGLAVEHDVGFDFLGELRGGVVDDEGVGIGRRGLESFEGTEMV